MDTEQDIFEEVPETVPALVLNEGQQSAFETVCEFISNPEHLYKKLLLDGWAGTGKTTVINIIVQELRRLFPRIRFGMTAPTHKAVQQLRRKSNMQDKLEFGTIHSFLGLKQVLKQDPKDQNKMIVKYEPEWNSKKDRKIDYIDVLIVDEASMLDNELYGHIDDAVRSSRKKVIFTGE